MSLPGPGIISGVLMFLEVTINVVTRTRNKFRCPDVLEVYDKCRYQDQE